MDNQLRRELLSTIGLNSWAAHNSSPRAQMFASHIGQRLTTSGATRKRIKTGMEYEFGKYTFSNRVPDDMVVLKTIQKYPETVGINSIGFNPLTVVIYENTNTNEIGIMRLERFCSFHQHFGFEYKQTENISKLYHGSRLAKDTILLDSPAITDDGDYMYGVELNMVFMSHPSVSEDGIMISRDVLDKFTFKTYENRTVEWGNKAFALNLYGDHDNYKPFPDIGEYIREDGLLMCTRQYDKMLSPVQMSIDDVMVPDFISDTCMYGDGGGGRIVDIKVHTCDSSMFENFSNMDTHVQKYLHASRKFYLTIIDEYKKIKRERGSNLRVTPEFQKMIVEALAYIGEENEVPRIIKEYKRAPLDHYRVDFVIEYNKVPKEGYKFTDIHGGRPYGFFI